MDIGALLSLPKDIAGAVGDVLAHISMGTATPRMKMVLEPFEEFFKKFTQGVKDILNPFEKLNEFATHFVQEFDPALVANLGSRFRDLNAVIGIALRPIVDIARDVVKALSDNLLPVMRKLEPIVRQIADAVGARLIKGFDELGSFLEEMMPAFEGMRDMILGLLPILDDLGNLLRVLRAPLISLIGDLISALVGGGEGGGIKGAMEAFRKGVQDVMKAIVQFVAMMLALFGQAKALDAMIKALKPPAAHDAKDSTGMANALNPMFKSIGELAKSVQLAMFVASDQAGKSGKQGVELTNELLDGMKGAIEAGQAAAKENQEAFDATLKEIKDWVVYVGELSLWIGNLIKEGGKKVLEGAHAAGQLAGGGDAETAIGKINPLRVGRQLAKAANR